jgi:hypothetical protein
MRHPASIALICFLAACGGASDGAGPNGGSSSTNVLSASSATSFTGQFGDAMSVAVSVKSPAGTPVSNASVTFAATDGGGLDATSVPTDSAGTSKVRWRLAALAKVQTLVATLGSQSVTFSATATTNPWTVGVRPSGVRYASRPADEGSLAGAPPNWSETDLGSPPVLMVSCSGGDPDVIVTHPKMRTTNGNISRQIDQEERVAEFWHPVFPSYDMLYAPGPGDNVRTGDLVKRLVTAKQFNIAFRNSTANTLLAPTFGTAGLSLVLPDVLQMCPGWT